MNPKETVAFGSVLALSLIVLRLSDFSLELVFSPLSNFGQIFSGQGFSLNASYLILFLVFLSLAYGIVSFYAIKSKKADYSILFGLMGLFPVFLLAFDAGFRLAMIIGLSLSFFIALQLSLSEKELYKKLSPYNIAKKASSKGIMMLNIILVISVFLTLNSAPSYGENAVNEFMSGLIGMSMDDARDTNNLLQEQQKQSAYALIDATGQSLAASIQNDLHELPSGERQRCISALQDNMQSINENTRKEIDRKLDSMQLSASMPFDVFSIMDTIIKYYPLISAISFLALLEFLRSLILAPLAGFFAWILWRFFGEKSANNNGAMDESGAGMSPLEKKRWRAYSEQ